jgi:hypothetical protein
MAIRANVNIINNTKTSIKIIDISPVNDVSYHTYPEVGSVVEPGGSVHIEVGNLSVFFASRGTGFSFKFIDVEDLELGEVYFDDPAIGAHSFRFGNEKVFKYVDKETSDRHYDVTISKA